MTTVAFDGNKLAADTQITSDWKSTGHSKFYKFHDGAVGAFAGTWSRILEAQRFLDGLSDHCPDEDWSALVIRADRRVYFMDCDGCRMDITGMHYAIGSGSHFALGAMACGKDAAEAVRISFGLDQYTGGDVESIEVGDIPPLPRRAKTTKRSTSKQARS